MSIFQVGKSSYFSGLYPKNNSALFAKPQKTPAVNKNALFHQLETLMSSKNSMSNEELKESVEEKKRLLRAIRTENNNPSTPQTNQIPSYLDVKTDNNTKNTPKKKINYDAKAISSAISQAKTSSSAGQVLIKARRKILELKRALVRGDSDKDEVMVAINHAKQMERIAKKKKHHLELEEMVEHTQKMDENLDPEKGKNSDSSGFSNTDFIELTKDKIDEAINRITEEGRSNSLSEDMTDYSEEITYISDEMISDFSEEIVDVSEEMFSQFTNDMTDFSEEMSALTEEALERLNETMELLENLEVVDPHMSKEDLKKLKIKHRNSEEKALVKADMDYLKDMLTLTMGKTSSPISSISGTASAPMVASAPAPSPAPAFVDISV